MNQVSEQKVSELLYQIDREMYELERKYAEMQNEAGRSEVERLVAKKREDTVSRAKQIIQKYQSKLNQGVWKSECCDSSLNYYPMNRSVCSECGAENPEAYNVEKSVEDVIEDSNRATTEGDTE